MPPSRHRILCTEDHPDTREMLTIILNAEGFEVVCTEDPDETIERARTQTFDLFLMDIRMTGLSGIELTEAIRQFDKKTPILFYSGAAHEKDKEAARLAGAQGYLIKPTDSDELVAEVVRIIAESKIPHPRAIAMGSRSV